MNATKCLQLTTITRSLQSCQRLHIQNLLCNQKTTTQETPTELEVSEDEQLQLQQQQEQIMKIRNKSRLEPLHYNIMHGKPNPVTEVERDAATLKEMRELYGRDGSGCAVDAKYLWPSKQEMLLMKEWEQVLFPLSLPEMMEKSKHDKQEAIIFAANRQKAIIQNMKGLKQWKQQVYNAIQTKEKKQQVENDKKEKLIEEVRQMLGFRISPFDEKFTEIVAKKEEEERKAEKALKKQQKQQKMLEQMKKLAASATAAKAESGKSEAEESKEKTTETPGQNKSDT